MQTTDEVNESPEDEFANAPEATPAEDSANTDSPESSDQATSAALDRKLAKENQSLRKRLRELESAQKERDEAELSEQERLQKRMVELEQQNTAMSERTRSVALRAEITVAAAKFGIVDADAAARLIDSSALEYDDTDGWIGVDEALRSLTHDRPWLVSTATPNGVTANPTNPPRRRSSLTMEQLKGMSRAEIAAFSEEEVNAVMTGH